MMADEFAFLWPQIQNYIAEADADLIRGPDEIELHGRNTDGQTGTEKNGHREGEAHL